MNIIFSKMVVFSLILATLFIAGMISSYAQHVSVWPIAESEGNNWVRVNSTFGERQSLNNPRFHAGTDIDNDRGYHSRAAQPGQRRGAAFGIAGFRGVGIEIDHEYPSNSGDFYRKTRYLHLDGDSLVPEDDWVATGDEVGRVNDNDGHLHFEMWEYDEDEDRWYMLNPLKNDMEPAWQVDSPSDIRDPEINNVLLERRNNHPDGIISGYDIPEQNNAITHHVENEIAKIHFRERPGSNESVYDPERNTLTVFGSLRPIVNTRDVDVTGKPLEADNVGLSIYSTGYSIEDTNGISQDMYKVEFSRIQRNNQYEWREIFHSDTERYGNNDYIELGSSDEVYLYPHRLMTAHDLNANGIWYTKARRSDPPVYAFDHAHLPETAQSH